MVFFSSPAKAVKESLLARLGLAMGTIVLLSFISMVVSTSIAENSLGKANAINSAGSLRMMSYRLLSYTETRVEQEKITDAVDEFQLRLNTLENFVLSRAADYSELPTRFESVRERWNREIAPQILGQTNSNAETSARNELEIAIPDFVEQINQIVFLLEDDLEKKIALLRSLQIALLIVTIAVCSITMWMMKNQVIRPLHDLLSAASQVRDKDFSAKVRHTEQDELGQLGDAFNVMVAEIEATYNNQNQLIAERTRELTDSNRSLELLYRSALDLSATNITPARLREQLDIVERELDLGTGTICIVEHGIFPAHRLASNLSRDSIESICGKQSCQDCFGKSEHRPPLARPDDRRMIYVPLKDNGSITGVMPFMTRSEEAIADWKIRVLEAIGTNISMALSNMQHREELHRMAVLEERSTIARELHDSIAQSLSYLRIQVTRLEKSELTPDAQHEIVAELKLGLAKAYKELRELISAFRLKMDERGFQTALVETVDEFRNRSNLQVNCQNALPPTLLSANEEIHVLRIIREALANIGKHANAQQVGIFVSISESNLVTVRITDDGIGINITRSPENHYGLVIMEDRARSLGGTIEVRNGDGRGTTVVLNFFPEKMTNPIRE